MKPIKRGFSQSLFGLKSSHKILERSVLTTLPNLKKSQRMLSFLHPFSIPSATNKFTSLLNFWPWLPSRYHIQSFTYCSPTDLLKEQLWSGHSFISETKTKQNKGFLMLISKGNQGLPWLYACSLSTFLHPLVFQPNRNALFSSFSQHFLFPMLLLHGSTPLCIFWRFKYHLPSKVLSPNTVVESILFPTGLQEHLASPLFYRAFYFQPYLQLFW